MYMKTLDMATRKIFNKPSLDSRSESVINLRSNSHKMLRQKLPSGPLVDEYINSPKFQFNNVYSKKITIGRISKWDNQKSMEFTKL